MNTPRDIPILMQGAMVRAILDDTKTNTRRVVKGQPFALSLNADEIILSHKTLPYGGIGDRLIVKEAAWMWCRKQANGTSKTGRQKWLYVPLREARIAYCADSPTAPEFPGSTQTDGEWAWRKKIGRFLPRWASRLTLEVLSVRVERVQEISEEDAWAEGIQRIPPGPLQRNFASFIDGNCWRNYPTAKEAFQGLWDSINAKRHGGKFAWEKNPHVWRIEFKRIAQ